MGLVRGSAPRLLLVVVISWMSGVSYSLPLTSHQDECQHQDQYKSQAGFCCSLCSPGTRKFLDCEHGNEPHCISCIQGTSYTETPNNATECQPCSLCNTESEDVVSECTMERDTVCQCKDGFGRLQAGQSCGEQHTGDNSWIFWTVTGGVAVVIVASLLGFCCCRKPKRPRKQRRTVDLEEMQNVVFLPKDAYPNNSSLAVQASGKPKNITELIDEKIAASEADVWKSMKGKVPALRECIDLRLQLFTEKLCAHGIISEEARDMAVAQPDEWRCTDYILQTVIERGERSTQKLMEMFAGIAKEQASTMESLASRYGCSVTLNQNSAHPNLSISQDLMTVTKLKIPQPHQDRFDHWYQVMSSNGVSTGQHYWEVDVSGSNDCRVGVAYETISRKGTELSCALGCNERSWALRKDGTACIAMHGRVALCHTVHKPAQRVGVYVNWDEGVVAFYIAEPKRLFYSFDATFTRPLYLALHVDDGSAQCIDLEKAKTVFPF